MTPAEIGKYRNHVYDVPADQNQTAENATANALRGTLYLIGEIAIQLAEQNELLRVDQEFRRSVVEEQRAEGKRRDALLEQSVGQIQTFADGAKPPVFAIPVPGINPEHIGCLVLMPDSSYAMAIEGRMIPLDPEESQRLIAILRMSPAEGKPQ